MNTVFLKALINRINAGQMSLEQLPDNLKSQVTELIEAESETVSE